MEELIELMKAYEDAHPDQYIELLLWSNGSGQLQTDTELIYTFNEAEELIDYLKAAS